MTFLYGGCRPIATCLMLTLAGGLLVSQAAFAQVNSGNVPVIPNQQNPSLLTAPELSPYGLDKRNSQQSPQEEMKLDVPERKSEAQYHSPPFLVTRIKLEGITLLTKSEIYQLLAPYEGKEQTLEQLGKLVESITMLYRQRGYLTAEAYIPPQDIVGGVLTIGVQEGFVGSISIEGNRFYRAHVIRRAVTLKPGELLNFRRLEKDLNRMNRLNDGFKVKAFLSAGDRPGQTNIKIKVAEKQPFQVSGTFDNQGRPFIGWYRTGIELNDDSLTSLGDKFNARWLASAGTQIAMGSYTLPLTRFGTELNTNFAYSHVNVRLPIKQPPAITAQTYNASIGLSQPLDPDRKWVLDGGVNYIRSMSYFDEFQTSNTDVRSIQTGLTYSGYDRWGRTYNRLQNTFGLGVGAATNRFWKVEDYFNRLIVLPKNNLLVLKAYAQMTPDGLPSIEQFQIGGAYSVRGYSQGLLIGDRGFNVGLEHRFPIPGLKKISPWLGDRLQGVWFYDLGRVWLDSSNPNYAKGISDSPQRTLLQSIGFGLRAQLTQYLQGFIDVGFGLNNRQDIEPTGQPKARIHFGIRSDLLPESYRMRSQKITNYMPRPVASRK